MRCIKDRQIVAIVSPHRTPHRDLIARGDRVIDPFAVIPVIRRRLRVFERVTDLPSFRFCQQRFISLDTHTSRTGITLSFCLFGLFNRLPCFLSISTSRHRGKSISTDRLLFRLPTSNSTFLIAELCVDGIVWKFSKMKKYPTIL